MTLSPRSSRRRLKRSFEIWNDQCQNGEAPIWSSDNRMFHGRRVGLTTPERVPLGLSWNEPVNASEDDGP